MHTSRPRRTHLLLAAILSITFLITPSPSRAQDLDPTACGPLIGKTDPNPLDRLVTEDGTVIHLRVEGQTPARNRFKREGKEFEEAGPNDLVTIEWFYHPFTPYSGTNGFRIGQKMYAYGQDGWKIHEGNGDDARAYVFANNWFKGLYLRYQKIGMPPFSVGIPLRVPKSKALAADKLVRDRMANPGPPFSILFNNCSQCAVEVFSAADLAKFSGGAYEAFSSFASTRAVFLQNMNSGAILYPLTGFNFSTPELLHLFPPGLYGPMTLPEIRRDVQITGEHILGSLYGKFKRLTGLQIPANWTFKKN